MWIRIDTDIAANRKTLVLRTSIGRPTPTTVGHLTMLLSRLADNESDGYIGDLPAEVIEEWAGWDGEPGLFDRAFRESFVTDGVIDGWAERQGTLMARQRKDRERKREERARKVRELSAGRPKDKKRTSDENPDATVTMTVTEELPKGARKPRSDKAAPWMAVIRPIYHERYDAEPPKRLVKELRPAVDEHGIDEVARRLRIYCERTEGRFFDGGRFVATWGEWDGEAPKVGADQAPDPAAEFYRLLSENELLHTSRDQFRRTVAKMAADGVIPDQESFMEQCKKLSWPELRRQSAERFAIAYIREHLFPARGVA